MPSDPEPAHPNTSAIPASADRQPHDRLERRALIRRTRRVLRLVRFGVRALKVLAVLSVPTLLLLAIAIPNVHRFQCRSMQSEAKSNLKKLYVAEESFRAEHDRYASDLGELGFGVLPDMRNHRLNRYWYLVAGASDEHFRALAIGRPGSDVAGDVWSIDEENWLRPEHNACFGKR